MVNSLSKHVNEYQKQLKKGSIQKAYKGLIKYIATLRTHFIDNYPKDFVASHIYQGYMDITYFAFTPISLKNKKLKIVIALNHEEMRFGVGQNKRIQEKYWMLLKDWAGYQVPLTSQDFVLGSILVENPDFSNLESLTTQIEVNTMQFIEDIANILK